MKNTLLTRKLRIIIPMISLMLSSQAEAQHIQLGLFADPIISWYSSDNGNTSSEGARAGFAAGFSFHRYFSQNYAFSSGLTIIRNGGVQSYSDDATFSLESGNTVLLPGEKVIYSADWAVVPLGLRLRTNQIGYFAIFSDFGIDPAINTKGRITIPSHGIENDTKRREMSLFAIGYHIHGGIEYSLGGTTNIVLGAGFDSSLADITKNHNDQPKNRTINRMIRFRLGLIF